MSFTLVGAFGAGLLTFLSPCVLPMAPILIASLLTTKKASRLERLRITLWFAAGFSVVFVVMGIGLPWIATALGSGKPWLIGIGGVLLALFGARMMGWFGESKIAALLTRTVSLPSFASRLPRGLQGLGFGALFGLTWTPCVGPILGGVLTYVASQEMSSVDGAFLLGSFAIGVTLPFIALAAASEWATPYFNRLKRHLPRIEYVSGLALFVFGMYVVSQSRLQDFVSIDQRDTAIAAMDSKGTRLQIGNLKPGNTRMVFFYSDHCPICHAMEKYLPEFEKGCVSSRFEFTRINVDQSENQEAASRFGVKAVPTVSVINDQGKEVVHLVGYQSEGRLREAARVFSELACADVSLPLKPLDENDRALIPGATCGPKETC